MAAAAIPTWASTCRRVHCVLIGYPPHRCESADRWTGTLDPYRAPRPSVKLTVVSALRRYPLTRRRAAVSARISATLPVRTGTRRRSAPDQHDLHATPVSA